MFPSWRKRRTRQSVSGREPDVLGFEPLGDLADAVAVLGIPLVVGVVLRADALVGLAVDVVRVTVERRQAARDERLGEPFRRERQVRDHAEAAEALAEDAPFLDPELPADRLRVAHDRVGPEVRQVLGLFLG